MIFEYAGALYPEFIKHGNACQYIAPIALQFCKGKGLDIGAGKWPLPGAIPVDVMQGMDAMELPPGQYDFIFSSHCLEHLANPIAALEHWRSRLRNTVLPYKGVVERGVLFLYLPHPEMVYWRPEHCRKHLHSWTPERLRQILEAVGFSDVMVSGRDMAFGFSAVAFRDAL